MEFSPRIRQIHARDVEMDPATHRPRIISSGGKNGIVMVYADWCPHCQRFKPWYNAYAETAPEDVFLGVIPSDEVDEIFETNEVPGFPCFKRVMDGRIHREEVSVNRASQEMALRSLRDILEASSAVSLDSLERRVQELEALEDAQAEVHMLRAELAKAAAIEAVYQEQLRALQERVRVCERTVSEPAALAPAKKKRVASKKSPSAKKSPSKKSPSAKKSPSKRMSKSPLRR